MDILSKQALGVVTAKPAAPSANSMLLYAGGVAGRSIPKWLGASGQENIAQPMLGQNRIALWSANGDNTTATLLAMTAPTTVGTITARPVTYTNLLKRMRRLGYVSAATAGAMTSWRATTAQFFIGNGAGLGGFTFIVRFGVSDAANVAGARMFIGMRDSTAAPTNVEPDTITNCIGVAKLSTSNNLQIVCGGALAQAPIDLGVNFPANTLSADAYELVLYANPNTDTAVGYRVTRLGTGYVAEGVVTAAMAGLDLPSSSAWLLPSFFRTNNATALAVGLDIATVYIETEF